jgi:hypothetical protein
MLLVIGKGKGMEKHLASIVLISAMAISGSSAELAPLRSG